MTRGWTFSPEEALLWIMDLILVRSDSLKVKLWILFIYTLSFLLHKMLIDELESCGLICDVFSSCLDSHSDGTHSMHRIHWWASDVMLNFTKSILIKKHLHLGWAEGEYIFIFGWTIHLMKKAKNPYSPVKGHNCDFTINFDIFQHWS